jgi:Methyltransferase domain/Tetratricopeptide repeat
MLRSFLRDLFGGQRQPIEDEGLRLARDLLEQSQHEEAIKVLTAMLAYKPAWTEALVLSGAAKRAAGRPNEGLADLTRALDLAPANAPCLYEIAMVWYALGDNGRALEYCERSRQADPGFATPRWLQAQILLGGESYFAVLDRIHAHLKPRTYLEIGVFRGESLRLARPPTQAIGVDPAPQLLSPPAQNQKVYAETSDTFFATHDLRAEFGGRPIDLAFIDGMHHFEFALRDFANVERHCTRASTVLIHDCYPLDKETARRDGAPPFWSGDIWRLIVLLRKYRPDLVVQTIGAPPTGLGLVRNLDPGSRFLIENHDRLVEEFLALDYAWLDEDKPGKLHLVANHWEAVRPLLSTS